MTHLTTQKLRKIMQEKQTNLSLSLDVTTKSEFLKITDLLGPEICVLKSHIDVIEDFDQDMIQQMQLLARKHNFLLFEDRKFADIGQTVQHQFTKSIFRTHEWADIINAHGVAGPGVIDSLRTVARRDTGLLLVAQLSCKDNLLTPEVTKTIVRWAKHHSDFVMGFIAQERLTTEHDFLTLSPGVHLDKIGDGKDQQYRTPEQAIRRDGCDIIIVGRAIYDSENPLAEAQKYKQAGWAALN